MLMARMVATVKQAKDKDRWIRLFSQFCNKTANEEEEIVHKLLGDKFKGQLELLRRLSQRPFMRRHSASGSHQMDSGLSLLLLGPMAKELGPAP